MRRYIEWFIWWITPMWFGNLLYRFGYIMGARFDRDSGKFLQLYFDKAGYPNLKQWRRQDDELRRLINKIMDMKW